MSKNKSTAVEVIKQIEDAKTVKEVNSIVSKDEERKTVLDAKESRLEALTENSEEENLETVEEVSPNEEVPAKTTNVKVTEAEDLGVESSSEVLASSEKMRTVVPLKSHTARIGGNVFKVTKDEVVEVPEGVAMILQRARVVVVK